MLNDKQKLRALQYISTYFTDVIDTNGQYNFDKASTLFVSQIWPRLKSVFLQKLQAFLIADPQQNKTGTMIAITDHALKDGVAGIVFVSGTNLNDSIEQLEDRFGDSDLFDFRNKRGLYRVGTGNTWQTYCPHKVLDGSVFICNKNPSKFVGVAHLIEKYILDNPLLSQHNVLLMDDESEEMAECSVSDAYIKSTKTEVRYNELEELAKKYPTLNLMKAKISASQQSLLELNRELGVKVTYDQIFELPASPYYHGISNNSVKLNPCLKIESSSKWNKRTGYKRHLTWNQVHNIEIIARHAYAAIHNPQYGYASSGLPQIYTINPCTSIEGHKDWASKMVDALSQLFGFKTQVIDSASNRIDPTADGYIILNNMENKRNFKECVFDIAQKKASNGLSNPLFIMSVGYKRQSKSNTFESKKEKENHTWNDINHNCFGYYNNFSVMYSSGKRTNIEAFYQGGGRACGVRPIGLKQHEILTDPDSHNDLLGYLADKKTFISGLQNNNGKVYYESALSDNAAVGIGRIARRTNRNKTKTLHDVPDKARLDNKVEERDYFIEIDEPQFENFNQQYKDTGTTTNHKAHLPIASEMLKIVKNSGKLPYVTDNSRMTVVPYRSFPSISAAARATKQGGQVDPQAIFTLAKKNGKFGIYVYNKHGDWKVGGGRGKHNKDFVEYDTLLNSQGYLDLSVSTQCFKNNRKGV